MQYHQISNQFLFNQWNVIESAGIESNPILLDPTRWNSLNWAPSNPVDSIRQTPNESETCQKYVQKASETRPTSVQNASEMCPKHGQNTAKTRPKSVPNASETRPQNEASRNPIQNFRWKPMGCNWERFTGIPTNSAARWNGAGQRNWVKCIPK